MHGRIWLGSFHSFLFFFFDAVLEYIEGNGACNISETGGGIDETTARRYFKDILSGVMYLHNHVSPFKNVVIRATMVIKIRERKIKKT